MRRDEQGSAVSKLFWMIVVLGVLAVVVDRVGDYAAERIAGDRLQASQRLDTRPDVDIAGFPFLTQFADSRYDHVSASAHDVPVGTSRNSLILSKLRVDFRTVTTSRDFNRFRARSATARATVDYADLSRSLGGRVSYGGNGRIKASKEITVLGETVRAGISVKPSSANDALSFVSPSIEGLEDAPPEVTAALEGIFDTDLSLEGIPFDVRVTSLSADRNGLRLVLSGKNLRYTPR